jgi:hypothetical protein
MKNKECGINQIFCSLFLHLKISNAKLVLGCVNVFAGLQNLCSFVLVDLQGNLDCSIPFAQNVQADPME